MSPGRQTKMQAAWTEPKDTLIIKYKLDPKCLLASSQDKAQNSLQSWLRVESWWVVPQFKALSFLFQCSWLRADDRARSHNELRIVKKKWKDKICTWIISGKWQCLKLQTLPRLLWDQASLNVLNDSLYRCKGLTKHRNVLSTCKTVSG